MRTVLLLTALLASTAHAEPPRHIELATDPLAVMHDAYTLDAAYAITDHVALTGELVYASDGGTPSFTSGRAQAGVRLYLDRAFQGPFLEGDLRRTHIHGDGYVADQAGNPQPFVTDYVMSGPAISVGWQWTFHDKYTVSYAIGTSKQWFSTGSVLGYAAGPEQDLRLGFVF